MLSIRQLAKTYAGPRQHSVLAGVDLDLAPGDYVAVMGESGIGKSTLLNLVAGLDRPDSGSIVLDGVELTTLDDNALTELRRVRICRQGICLIGSHTSGGPTAGASGGQASARVTPDENNAKICFN